MNVLDEQILRLMEEHQVVGLAAAVIVNGELIWSHGYGWANTDKQIPVTAHTAFRIASISKTVVATALMQLMEQGRCELEADCGELLGVPIRNPRFPEIPVTIQHLMTHTSGLQDEYVDFVVTSRNENPPRTTMRDFLLPGGKFYSEKLWGDLPSGHQEGFEYSNAGAVILAAIVETLSGQRFDQYCRNHIFKPLGMNHTSFNIQDFENMDDIGVLYHLDEESGQFKPSTDDFQGIKPSAIDYSEYVPGTNGALFSPQGGLRTSAADLSRFLAAHANGGQWNGVRILKTETIERMHEAHWSGIRQDGFFRNSALQFQITEDLVPGQKLIGHAGDAYGLLSDMYFSKSGWGFILIMNGLRQQKGHHVYFQAEEDLANLLYNTLIKCEFS